MKKLKLILSPIDGINFTIITDKYGPENSQLPFFDEQGNDHLFTILNCLDVIGTKYKIRNNDDQKWMKQVDLIFQEDSQSFEPNLHTKMTEHIGQKLYQSLFIGKIQQALFQKLGEAKGKRLHIEIQYDANVIESSLLPLYPWQLVHDGQEFLAEYQVTFSCLIAHKNLPPQGKRKVKQINILLIPSTAYNEQYQPIKSKELVINQGLTKASKDGYANLLSWYQGNEKPTIGRLRAYLTEQNEPPDIIHFDGHAFFRKKCPNLMCPQSNTNQIFHSLSSQNCEYCGSVLEESQGFLFFDKDESGIDYVSGAEFARVVGINKPMLVVITACKSALAYKSDSVFNGVAQKLLRQVPAVVATPFSLSEESATNFVEQLYRALGAKKSLLEAVKLATDAMHYHKYEWYRPVIFLRSDSDEDGNLFEWEVSSSKPPLAIQQEKKNADPKIEEIEKDIERLRNKYEALKGEARDTRDPDAKIDLNAKAEKIYDELKFKQQELQEEQELQENQSENITNRSIDTNRNYLIAEEKLLTFDYTQTLNKFEQVIEKIEGGGAGLFVVEKRLSNGGKYCSRKLIHCLKQKTSSGKFFTKEINPIYSNQKEQTFLQRLAQELQINIDSEYLQNGELKFELNSKDFNNLIMSVIKEIHSLFSKDDTGFIYLFYFSRYDALLNKENFWEWFIENFWKKLLESLPLSEHPGLKLIFLFEFDLKIPATISKNYCNLRRNFDSQKIVKLPLPKCKLSEIQSWLYSYSGFNRPYCDSILETIEQATQRRADKVYDKFLEHLTCNC